LLTSVASGAGTPYKAVATHGWVVDGEGKAMHKSLGNAIDPAEVVDQYGADILRLWVASSDYHADIRISKDILKQLSEIYRKIRNTARFILGCLGDFDPNKDMVAYDKLNELDKYALSLKENLVKNCRKAYEDLEFHFIFHNIHNFCVVDMSNFYLDVIKDRLYCEKGDSETRRAAQTVIYDILDTLTRLIAPILAFTSDEIWSYMPHLDSHDTRNIIFNEIPEAKATENDEFMARWQKIQAIRDDVKKALEIARNDKVIGASLEANVTVCSADDEIVNMISDNNDMFKDILIVSGVSAEKCDGGEFKGELVGVTVKHAEGAKCERCWIYSDTVGKNSQGANVCERCAKVLGL